MAAKGERSLVRWAVLLSLVGLLALVPTAEATRTLPSAVITALEPGPPAVPALDLLREPEIPGQTFGLFAEEDLSLFAALSLLDATEIERLSGENRFRLFADSGEISHLVKRVLSRKTALPASTSRWECNVRAPRDLAHICVDLFFQGAWTDPDTGIAYHRNRWYDPRTANWLSEDPLGAVDSPNLYAFVGWGPHVGRDPLGLTKVGVIRAEIGQYDVFQTERTEVGVGALDYTFVGVLNEARNAAALAVNVGTNLLGYMGAAEGWATDQLVEHTPLTEIDISFLEIYFAANPEVAAAAINTARSGGVRALSRLRTIAKERGWGDDLAAAWQRLRGSNLDDAWSGQRGSVKTEVLLPGVSKVEEALIPSKILRKNMKDAGVRPPPYPNAAHHIVAESAEAAAPARAHLADLGIEINSAENGIFLRFTEKGSGPLHLGGHTRKYYDAVNQRILRTKTREDAIEALGRIENDMMNGILPL